MMKKTTLLCILLCLLFSSLDAQEPVTYEQAFPNLSFQYPVEIQNANDDSNRLFVVEQSGRIKVFNNDKSTSQQVTFLDLRNVISFSSGQEIGLLGLAFHPNYAQNGYLYVYHTESSSVSGVNVEIVVARYKVSSSNANQADPGSRLEILSFDKNQIHSNHNGGKIAFGPDGYLYISIGDGGGGGDPNKNAQNINNPFGSILRIDVDVDGNNPIESNPDAPNGNYEIPSDNPRRGQSGLDELYVWGIRNTWKFSFDAPNNRMWGADVGQGDYEEINIIKKGGNYGWNRYEGNSSENSGTSLATSPDTKPVFQYNHNSGDVSITGGYVYRGASNNSLIKGKYIFGDYVSGRVWALDYNASNNTATSKLLFRTNGEFISSFGLDEAGELYFSGYGSSAKIFKINGGEEEETPPSPTTTAVNGIGTWKDMENGTNGIVEAVVSKGDNLYVAGSFSTAGGISANNVAVYNKNSGWSTLSSGANGRVTALALASDGSLYAGGGFTSIGGITANNVAVWDGTTWKALGAGTNGPVAKIGIDSKNNVYVGGTFETAGGLSVANIAKWNNGWSALVDSGTSGRGTNNEIRSIAFDSNDVLYVGGNFDNAGGKTANRIATYDGSTWGTLGEGTSGFVQSIIITSGQIYVGGNFTIAGGKTVNRIARWDRNAKTWQPLGDGLSGNVNAMAHDGTYLYVGGSFETGANTSGTNYILKNMARWSSSDGWQAMGPANDVGTSNRVNSMALSDNEQRLYVGGNFNTAGNLNTKSLSVWGQSFDCTDERITIQYKVDETEWTLGDSAITIDKGTNVILRMDPTNQQYTISSPTGNEITGPYDLTNITPDQAGIYTIKLQNGCSKSITVNVTAGCNSESMVVEYQMNDTAWEVIDAPITVDEGDKVVLRMNPAEGPYTIETPSGNEVTGPYDLGNITMDQAGTYIIKTQDDCSKPISINVNEGCSLESIAVEYNLNNAGWISGDTKLTVDQGTEVALRIVPENAGFSFGLPNGQNVEGVLSLGEITPDQAGIYIISSGATCSTTFEITVIGDGSGEPTCTEDSLIPEYSLDGAWSTGEAALTIESGTDVVLGVVSDSVEFTITLPNNSIVNGDYSMGKVTAEDSGTYVFTSEEGCSTNLALEVLEVDAQDCDTRLITEYRINGLWLSGAESIDINEGSDVIFSMLPNGIGLNITLPDGRVVGDHYRTSRLNASQGGTYILTSAEGCTKTLDVNVIDNCLTGDIIPEYRLDGVWKSGETDLTVDEGTSILLSMLPNGVGLMITRPDGTVVGDNHNLGNVTVSQSGTYILQSEEGCTETLNLTVSDIPNCTNGSFVPEYRLDGVWNSGQNFLSVDEGTELVLSAVGEEAGVTITLPKGRGEVGDNHNLGKVTTADTGVYIIRSAQGCKSTLTLTVLRRSSSKSANFDEFASEFTPTDFVEGNLEVFPNPTLDRVSVNLSTKGDQYNKVRVFDMHQRKLLSKELDESQSTILELDFARFSPGMYFISLKKTNGDVITKKVIKKE